MVIVLGREQHQNINRTPCGPCILPPNPWIPETKETEHKINGASWPEIITICVCVKCGFYHDFIWSFYCFIICTKQAIYQLNITSSNYSLAVYFIAFPFSYQASHNVWYTCVWMINHLFNGANVVLVPRNHVINLLCIYASNWTLLPMSWFVCTWTTLVSTF